jgi:hypothetical protein
MSRFLPAALCAILTACGATGPQKYEQQQSTTQVPVTPLGVIYVRVIDGSTFGGLVGADVRVIGATATGQTDADGAFKLESAVVGSTYTFIIEKAGYTRTRVTASLPTTTGTSPLANPVTTSTSIMYRNDGEVRGTVFFPSGRPAPGAVVVLDPSNTLSVNTYEPPPLTATAAEDGSFKIVGVPSRPLGITHTVYAMAFDQNADGSPDFATTSVNITAYDKVVTRTYLTYTNNLQRILNSNIIDGELASGENPTFTFAMPVLAVNLNQAAAGAFTLTNTTRGNVAIPVDVTWTGTTQATVKPTAFRDGDRYQLAISLTTQDGAAGTAAGFSATYAFQVRPSTPAAFTEQVTNFLVTSSAPPSGGLATDYDFNSTGFKLQWDGTAKAVSYFVFARDTGVNSGWVQLAGPVTQVGSGTQRYVYTVSTFASFPSFCPSCTTPIWPLAYNNRVTFSVVGMDTYGDLAPLAAAPTQTVSDNWAPRATNVTLLAPSVVDAWNETSTPTTILLRLTYNEPMDPATRPTFAFPAGVTTAFVWDSFTSSYSGTLTVTVPANTDGTGTWAIRGGKDMAGNTLTYNELNGSFGGKKELLTNGSFEDAAGTCLLTGWTGTQTNSMPTPFSAQGNAKLGACAAVIGTPLNLAPATGSSRLTQDVALPSLPVGSTMYFASRLKASFTYAPAAAGVGSLAQVCRLTDATNTPILGSYFSYGNLNSAVGSGFETTIGSGLTPGTTVRVLCEVDNVTTNPVNGTIYLDDVGITQVKPAAGGQFLYGP